MLVNQLCLHNNTKMACSNNRFFCRLSCAENVVINKVDKSDARPDEVLDMVFDLFVELGANDDQLDFETLYGSGRDGWLSHDADEKTETILPLLDTILDVIPSPPVLEGVLDRL